MIGTHLKISCIEVEYSHCPQNNPKLTLLPFRTLLFSLIVDHLPQCLETDRLCSKPMELLYHESPDSLHSYSFIFVNPLSVLPFFFLSLSLTPTNSCSAMRTQFRHHLLWEASLIYWSKCLL